MESNNWLSRCIYGSVGKDFYKENRKLLNDYNYKMVRVIILAIIVVDAIFDVLCITTHVSNAVRNMFFSFSATFLILFLLVWFVLPKHIGYTRFFYYLISLLIFLQTLASSTIFSPTDRMVVVFMSIIMLPALFVEAPIHSIISIILMCTVTAVVDLMVKGDGSQNLVFDDLAAIAACFIVSIPFTVSVRRKDLINIQARKYFEMKAEIDGLTEVYNHDSSERLIDKYLDQNDDKGAYIILDIDDFKKINDNYGHLYGDKALKGIGKILTETFRRDDIVGRLGGDEFVVFMKAINNNDMAESKAVQIEDKIRELGSKMNENIPITCSIGIAFRCKERNNFELLYQAADTALYQAKEKGKGNYVIFLD